MHGFVKNRYRAFQNLQIFHDVIHILMQVIAGCQCCTTKASEFYFAPCHPHLRDGHLIFWVAGGYPFLTWSEMFFSPLELWKSQKICSSLAETEPFSPLAETELFCMEYRTTSPNHQNQRFFLNCQGQNIILFTFTGPQYVFPKIKPPAEYQMDGPPLRSVPIVHTVKGISGTAR